MNAQEFKERYLPLGKVMYALAMRLLHHPDEAQEVVQECFSLLWERKDRLHEVAQVQAYCLSVVRNTALLRLRKAQTWEALDERKDDMPETDEGETRRQELQTEAWQLLEALPDDAKEIFRLRFIHGMKADEIAQRTGKTAENVRAILSRNLKRMRTTLQTKE